MSQEHEIQLIIKKMSQGSKVKRALSRAQIDICREIADSLRATKVEEYRASQSQAQQTHWVVSMTSLAGFNLEMVGDSAVKDVSTESCLRRLCCCWPALLESDSRVCCFYKAIFCPCVLCCHAVFKLCLPWLWLAMRRVWLSLVDSICTRCWGEFNDTEFSKEVALQGIASANDSARRAHDASHSPTVEWQSAGSFGKYGPQSQLFSASFTATEVSQGALGDCWLMASMACLAEHDGAIQSLFRSRLKSSRGKYHIRLFDDCTGRWDKLIIDDKIPVTNAGDGKWRPWCSKHKNAVLWVMLLEKAFAKMWGGYAKLSSGHCESALVAMTGDHAFRYVKQKETWARFHKKDRKADSAAWSGETVTDEMLFEKVHLYLALGGVACASTGSTSAKVCERLGLKSPHAYSILKVASKKDSSALLGDMVQLRNPWGEDASGGWCGERPTDDEKVAKALGFKATKVGDAEFGSTFWILWVDFVRFFDDVVVLDRTVDMHSVVLDVKDDEWCSATRACIGACCRYWCCCRGFRRLYFPHRGSKGTLLRRKKIPMFVWIGVLVLLCAFILFGAWLVIKSPHRIFWGGSPAPAPTRAPTPKNGRCCQ